MTDWNTPAPKPKRTARNIVLVTVAAVVALCGGFAAVIGAMGPHNDKSAIFIEPSTAAPPVISKKPVEVGIGEGTWQVGKDVKPGKYKTAGASDSQIPLCYWDVRTGSETGTIKAQGANDKATAQGLVTLKTGEYFTTSGCQPWKPTS